MPSTEYNTLYAPQDMDMERIRKEEKKAEERRKVRHARASLYKAIKADNELSIEKKMLGDKGNALKYIATLNHRHSWDKQKEPEREESRPVLSLSDLPKHRLEKMSDNLQLPDFDDED